MRKKVNFIFYLVFSMNVILLISCGVKEDKQNEGMNEQISAPAMDDGTQLEEVFKEDLLNTEQLLVFNQRATQKVNDFISYVELISNKSFDSQMRNAAKEQVFALFTDSTISLALDIDTIQKDSHSLSVFLSKVYSSSYDSLKISADSVLISRGFELEGKGYSGTIALKIKIEGYVNGRRMFDHTNNHKAKTELVKTSKNFGKNTELIWTVKLGDFE